MKQAAIIFLSFLFAGTVCAQRLSLNIAGGVMNYGGDVQDKVFTFNQSKIAFAAGVSYKFSSYFSVSAFITGGKLAASDAKTNQDNYRRNLSFYTNITEGSLRLEAFLKDVPVSFKFTPYAFVGAAIYHFNPYTYDTAGQKQYLNPLGTEGQGLPEYPDRQPYKLTQFAIPFGGGVAYALSDNVMISAEVGFRKLFTDYLDDVSSLYYADTAILRRERGPLSAKMSFRSDETTDPLTFTDKLQRGNPLKKDTYYTCLIKLSFALGNGDGSGTNWYSRKAHKHCGCPGKIL